MSSEKSLSLKVFDVIQPFIIGGCSGIIGTCILQPVDFVKVIIQLKSEEAGLQKSKLGGISVAKDIFKNHGAMGFYRGYFWQHP